MWQKGPSSRHCASRGGTWVQVTGPSRAEEIATGRAEWLPFLIEERAKLAGARFQYAEGLGIPHAVKSGRALPFPLLWMRYHVTVITSYLLLEFKRPAIGNSAATARTGDVAVLRTARGSAESITLAPFPWTCVDNI